MAERGAGSARRRRERRLRSWLRLERMTVRMELAAARHHSAFKGAGTHDAPRSQKTVNSRQEAVFFELYDEDTTGLRPTGLVEPPGPQERVPRHTVEQMADLAPRVLILDAPVPQPLTSLCPSRRSKCPRSPAIPVLLFVGLFLCRRQRNSWWTCHCLLGCGWLSGPTPPARCGPAF